MPKTKSRGARGGDKKKKEKKSDAQKVFEDDTELKVYNDAEDYEKEDNEEDEDSDDSEDNEETNESKEQQAFFGIVDRQELEYFKSAESTLAVDGFSNAEERELFINAVFDEARGKELKLITNQICSKLVERLILLGNNDQLKQIFNAFQNRFLQLSKHKYSSHCVETLLVRCAALVEREMVEQPETDGIEEKIIKMVNELKPELMNISQDPYASHVLRLTILILLGAPLPSTTQTSKLRSKKSKIARKMISIKDNDEFKKAYQIPDSFKKELQQEILQIFDNLDDEELKKMAIHKISSPVIQILIQAESQTTSEKKKKKGILPLTNKIFSGDKEEAFVQHLLSDPIGSHFMESSIEWMPLKQVEKLYSQYVEPRVGRLSRQETATFVLQSFLKRLRVQEVQQIIDAIIPDIPNQLETNIVMVRALIDAATQHEYKLDEITDIMFSHFNITEKPQFLEKILNLENSTLGNTKGDWPTMDEMHRSLLLQSLIKGSSKFLEYTLDAFIEMPQGRVHLITRHSVFSHILETCLQPQVNVIQRRKLLNHLEGLFVELACNAYGSHLVDKCWKFCYKLKHFRERIAEELVAETDKVKNSIYGKRVWRNWNLDKYVRKKFEWWNIVKAQEDEIAQSLGDSARPAAQMPNNKFNRNHHNKKSGNNNNDDNTKRFKPYTKRK